MLTRILRDGAGAAARLDLRDWDLLIRQARFAGLEPRLDHKALSTASRIRLQLEHFRL